MIQLKLLAAAVLLTLVACNRSSAPQAPAGYRLVWADEFDYRGLPDSSRWAYDTGGHGWGNNELQFYTKNRTENARVENGRLIIEARREPFENREYTSARLVTRDRQAWTYGRIEARARLPRGTGTWPAIWTLGTNIREAGWPLCGEIDIMEHVGYAPDTVHGTVHTAAYNHRDGTHKSATTLVPRVDENFYVYAVDWTPEEIRVSVDGRDYFIFPKAANATAAEWPFDQDQYLLLNIAVGGNWGGQRGVDTTIWPQRMEVDWVRVYQRE